MQVLLAEHAGFCFGVKRAIAIVEEALENNDKVFLLGPIIHNPQEVLRLEQLGAKTISSIDECDKNAHIVISTHGVSPAVITQIEKRGLTIIDTTCPIVKKAQSAAQNLEKEGYTVIIVGEASHPEVLGILGHIQSTGYVLPAPDTVPSFTKSDRIGIIAQTTMPVEIFEDVINSIKPRVAEVKVINTICNATRLRQNAAISLAQKVDSMLIIGGRNSANTCRLSELCKKTLKATYHIEAVHEIQQSWFHDKQQVGITAGASTPQWIVEEVTKYVTNI